MVIDGLSYILPMLKKLERIEHDAAQCKPLASSLTMPDTYLTMNSNVRAACVLYSTSVKCDPV